MSLQPMAVSLWRKLKNENRAIIQHDLLQAALKLFIMFLVHWVYAIVCILAVFLVWLYIGTANPAVKPGLAAEFHFFKWLRYLILRCCGYIADI